jgi:hypothetical protein
MPEADRDPIEPPDEPVAGSPDVQMLVQTIKELAATNARYEALFAERAAPPITWLTIKAAADRALIGDVQMRRWEKRGWVKSRREGRQISIDQDSLDARLRRLGRKPYLKK